MKLDLNELRAKHPSHRETIRERQDDCIVCARFGQTACETAALLDRLEEADAFVDDLIEGRQSKGDLDRAFAYRAKYPKEQPTKPPDYDWRRIRGVEN